MTFEPICGDGVKKPQELCDDNNTTPDDGCNSACLIEAGWSINTSASPNPTKMITACGDFYIRGLEQCEDGNLDLGDGCYKCMFENGYTHVKLPIGSMTPPGDNSTFTPNCGDNIKVSQEECEDGAKVKGDGCDDFCKIEIGWYVESSNASKTIMKPICNDGLVKGNEACDDGNSVQYDGCFNNSIENNFVCHEDSTGKSICKVMCGDGIVNFSEECDNSNTIALDGCNLC